MFAESNLSRSFEFLWNIDMGCKWTAALAHFKLHGFEESSDSHEAALHFCIHLGIQGGMRCFGRPIIKTQDHDLFRVGLSESINGTLIRSNI